jgi:hypothetical protein
MARFSVCCAIKEQAAPATQTASMTNRPRCLMKRMISPKNRIQKTRQSLGPFTETSWPTDVNRNWKWPASCHVSAPVPREDQ